MNHDAYDDNKSSNDTIIAINKIIEAKEKRQTTLFLNGLALKTLPEKIFELHFLETLSLSDTNISNIDRIGELTSLKNLDLQNTQIEMLPPSIGNLKNLEKLNLINTQLKDLPNQIFDLANILDLNISNCPINHIPEDINKLERLEIFWLYGVPIKELHLKKNILNQLIRLGIGHTGIENYSFLTHCTRLRDLSIGNKHFTDWLWTLESINSLTGLMLFDLEVDSRLSILKSSDLLTDFFLAGCNIKDISFLLELKNLTSIEIHNCNSLSFPDEIGSLKALKRIHIRNTSISTLPTSVGQLKNLHTLRLNNNNLVSLPPEISMLERLQTLDIYDNNKTLISPPEAVVQKGQQAIISYFKDLLQKEKLWSSKMILVGEGGMGKSCLLDSLLSKPFNSSSSTTHGINIQTLKYVHPEDGCEMNLNVWDFGGQDIYHATHQFYLTNHSLFILVWSARVGYEAGKIYNWLEVINALAPDSPVFIIATNSGPRGADLPKGDIEKQFSNKISFFEVDNKTGLGIEELKTRIREEAMTLKYMGVERPKSWINAKNEIATIDKYYIKKVDAIKIFNKYGVSHENHESLLNYLHDLGNILYFPEEALLHDTIILQPQWVSEQIAKILDSRAVSENAGFLTKQLVQELWSDFDASIHEKLIVLMEKFDLSYKTKDDKDISLIVEKLKFEEPAEYEKIWEELTDGNEISFKYVLDTIPPGIPTWFIARTHRFSTKTHWRYGVILKNETKDNVALVLTSPERREVWLRVKGNMPYYFFALLRDTLELTFGRFEGLKVNTLVPCPGHDGKPCPHFFDLKQLERRLSLSMPKVTIECPVHPESDEVDVFKMLFGISFAPNNSILVKQITERVEEVILAREANQTSELKKFIALEFIKTYQKQQEIQDTTCPNTFVLNEVDQDGLEVDLLYRQLSLQLCCQMPGCSHFVGDPYKIKIPRDWLRIVGPYYNRMIGVLRWTLPMIVPGAKIFLDKIEYDSLAPELELAKETAKALPEFSNFNFEQMLDDGTQNDLPIRIVKQILDSVDPTQQWGGLRRLVSPEGHILWLCPEHYNTYK